MVYVLDTTGKPLMPTARYGKVRRLLRDGRASVVRLQPFTIQLAYESKRYTQEVSLGIDAGSVHIGVSATTEKKELFSAEVVMRTDIVKKIAKRSQLRRARRCRKTRYRAARFNNRRKGEGWLAPSIRYKVDSHLKVIRLLHSILPIYKTDIEVAQFDTQKINNPEINPKARSNGEQMGFWNVREYVLVRDGHKCQHCKGKSGDKILNVHHLESRKTGGNAPNNLITLCETCHKAYHRGEIHLKQKRGASLRNAAAMNSMRWEIYYKAKDEIPNIHATFGYYTKHTRIKNNIEKTHLADAFCITNNVNAKRMDGYYKCVLVARNRRILHQVTPKKNGVRKGQAAPHYIGKEKFQKYDCVEWVDKIFFITGSDHNRPILRDIDGNLATPKKTVLGKYLRLLYRKRNGMMIQYQSSH